MEILAIGFWESRKERSHQLFKVFLGNRNFSDDSEEDTNDVLMVLSWVYFSPFCLDFILHFGGAGVSRRLGRGTDSETN